MAKTASVESTSRQTVERRVPRGAAYRANRNRLDQFEELARLVIKYRAARGMSQMELARRVGTSHSAISRLESGRHKATVETLQRVAHALGLRLVLGFESGSLEEPSRELIGSPTQSKGESGASERERS